jgi:hypothetical protein
VIFLLGLAAAVTLRERSEAVGVVSGIGDERIRLLHLRTCASAGLIMVAVIVVWYLATVVGGDTNQTLGLLALIFNASLIGAAAVLSRRG